MKHYLRFLITLLVISAWSLGGYADTATKSWDLTSANSDWVASGNEKYFGQPYGFKKKDGTLTNKSIADFKKEGVTQIKVGFKCLQNGDITSKITIYLVDSDGNVIGDGQEFTPINKTSANATEYVYATFSSNLEKASGFMMKVTTFGKNILVNGASYEVTYTSDGTDNKISLSVSPATSTVAKAPVEVKLTASRETAAIYYTTNGDEPTTSSTKYNEPFYVTKSGTTVKAIAVAEGCENATAEATYTIQPEQPVFSRPTKTFKKSFDVTLSLPTSADENSTIHYAIGKTATAESSVYNGPITIAAETDGEKVVLHAVVVDQYGNVGTEKFCTYTKTTDIFFDFTDSWDGITPAEASKNTSDNGQCVVGKELDVDGVVMTATNRKSNSTTYYTGIYTNNDEQTLRVYGSVTFTAPEGCNLSEIVLVGKDLSKITSNSGNTGSSYTWVGDTHEITFSTSNSFQIKTATIELVAVSDALDFVAENNDGYYATFSFDKDVVFTNDVVVYGVSVADGKVNQNELTASDYTVSDATAGSSKDGKVKGYYVPAMTGVLINSIDKTTTYYFPKETQSVTLPDNQLKAAPTYGGTFTAETGYKYYKLAYDNYTDKSSLGFYWGAADGGAFAVKACSAYLAVPTSDANDAKGFAFDGGATGINDINAADNVVKGIYNLNGQRMDNMSKAGLYIVNGKKVVIRK